MNVRVQYTAQLRTAIGRGEEEVALAEGSSLADLLAHLAGLHGEQVRPHLLGDDGQPRASLLVVRNGEAISAREAAMARLQPNDVVTLMPPIAGG
jgi:molybdopterin converting factor small subunit